MEILFTLVEGIYVDFRTGLKSTFGPESTDLLFYSSHLQGVLKRVGTSCLLDVLDLT